MFIEQSKITKNGQPRLGVKCDNIRFTPLQKWKKVSEYQKSDESRKKIISDLLNDLFKIIYSDSYLSNLNLSFLDNGMLNYYT